MEQPVDGLWRGDYPNWPLLSAVEGQNMIGCKAQLVPGERYVVYDYETVRYAGGQHQQFVRAEIVRVMSRRGLSVYLLDRPLSRTYDKTPKIAQPKIAVNVNSVTTPGLPGQFTFCDGVTIESFDWVGSSDLIRCDVCRDVTIRNGELEGMDNADRPGNRLVLLQFCTWVKCSRVQTKNAKHSVMISSCNDVAIDNWHDVDARDSMIVKSWESQRVKFTNCLTHSIESGDGDYEGRSSVVVEDSEVQSAMKCVGNSSLIVRDGRMRKLLAISRVGVDGSNLVPIVSASEGCSVVYDGKWGDDDPVGAVHSPNDRAAMCKMIFEDSYIQQDMPGEGRVCVRAKLTAGSEILIKDSNMLNANGNDPVDVTYV